ncbi:MAG: O-antigen ligase family protein [Ginsengibacter sp.]
MKELFFINDTLENKVSYYFLACFLIALPFAHFFSEILLVFFAIHTLIHLRSGRLAGLRNKSVWIVSSIFFFNLIAVTYSSYPAEGLKNVSQQLGILLFPFCFAVTGLNIRKYRLPLFKIFAFTCTATILYLYINTFRVIHFFEFSYTTIVSSFFINQNFSEPIGLHATYFSMYIVLSISVFIYIIIRERNYKNIKYFFCIAILIAGLVQLASRSVLICLILVALFGISFFLLEGKKRIRFFSFSLIAFFVTAFIILNVSTLKKRYLTDLENDLNKNVVTADFSESRMKRWEMEIGIIKQSPVIGYGNGSEKYLLKENYFKNKYYKSYLLELNAHNQYLSFLINSGIIGLLVYLSVLYYGFSIAIKQKYFILFSFLILITIVSMAENILDVNKGVFFYSFFYSLLIIPDQKRIYL